MIQKGLIAKLVKCFFDCVKLKKQAHITSFLDLFLKLGSYSEAQISLVRIPDFVDNILELMVWKSENVAIPSLDLLRRLLLVRENKSVFLSNGTTLSLQVENFYSTISHLMKSKSLQIVNLATFSLWALIYDFEKAKVDFKNHDFEKILTAIETQKDEKSKMQKENKFLAKTVLQLMGK